MSLIIANSTQDGYNRSEGGVNTRTKLGIENPSQFQNHFTSPIKIPTNAEIAVESVKIRRDALIEVEAETMMYHYFGHLQTDDDGPFFQDARNEMPIPIKPRPGTYSVDEWVSELEDRLDDAYGNPEIFGFYGVETNPNASGQVQSITIDSIQRGSVASKNRISNTNEFLTDYWQAPYQLSDGYKPTENWTSTHSTFGGTAHKVFTRVADNNASDDTILKKLDRRECSVIGHGHPMGLCLGRFTTDVTGAKSGGWRVGLSRPQIEYVRDTTKPAGRGRANLLPGTRHPDGGFDDNVCMSTHYRMTNQATGRYQKDFYDYMVQSDGDKISVFQLSYDNEVQANMLIMSEVIYYGTGMAFATQLTNASFNASFAAVTFRTHGDEVSLHFDTKGVGGTETDVLIKTVSTKRNQSFLPIGETRNALYPRFNVGTKNDLLRVYDYRCHYSQTGYRFPTYDVENFTFTTGDDFYSNNRVDRFSGGKIGGDDNKAIVRDTKDRPFCLSQTLICDTKPAYEINTVSAETRDSVYDGLHVGSTSINKKHLFVIGFVEAGTKDDYLQGKYRTIDTSGRAKMNRLIGFNDKSIIDETSGLADGYVAIASSGAQVSFTSYTAPDFRVNSAFVRISNMPIQSYNGGKQSVSKILYHLPRFTNDGREFGDLFFSPGEKTYVSLHNAGPEVLNNIEVQIVDSQERPVSDISGNTIVVFHMREKE
tara:strand:- start:1494 stop:3620 length:2127 start_codon:yes stop_codon:yes gene_type:complete